MAHEVELFTFVGAQVQLLTADGKVLTTADGKALTVQASAASDTSVNGLCLEPIACTLSMKLNGEWIATLTHPADEKGARIAENALIRIKTPQTDRQLYRIASVERTGDIIVASAYPVFLDCADEVYIPVVHPTNTGGMSALGALFDGTQYSYYTNIGKLATAYWERKNAMACIAGDDDNAFLKRWGGEIAYNNYTIEILEHQGADRHVRVETGLNLTAIKETVDTSELVTRFVPVAFNGRMLPEVFVESARMGDYPKVFTKEVDFKDMKLASEVTSEDETGYETKDDLFQAMRERVAELIAGGADVPRITYEVSMVDLAHTDAYKDYAELSAVYLGDTVHCHHNGLNIDTDARVIELTYDCIYGEVTGLVLGDFTQEPVTASLQTEKVVNMVIDKNRHTVLADRINGIINAYDVQLHAQKDVAQRQEVRAILFEDLDENSPTYGALSIGTQGFQVSKLRDSFGNWVWTTYGTADGFVADNIIGKHLMGYLVEGSVLKFGDDPNTMELKSTTDGVRAEGHGDYEVVNKDEGNHYMNRIYMTNRARNYIDIRNYSNSTAKNFVQMEASATKNDFYACNRDYVLNANANLFHMWSEAKPDDPAYPDGGVNGIEIFNRAYNSSTINSRILFDYNLTAYAKEWITLNAKKLVLKIDGINNMEVYVTSDGTLKVRNIT